jgi:DNA-nicking Smr family endonuclease
MSRRLTGEERALWSRLKRSVTPLRAAQRDSDETREPGADAPEKKPPKASAARAVAEKAPPKRSPHARLEERTLRRLKRGLTEVDDRIDLHGMRQERAFSALVSFLRHNQARGSRLVLVITGKGLAGGEGRGILKQSVPQWLTRPDLRELIVGFAEADRRHGGAGALVVQIRRRGVGRRDRNS